MPRSEIARQHRSRQHADANDLGQWCDQGRRRLCELLFEKDDLLEEPGELSCPAADALSTNLRQSRCAGGLILQPWFKLSKSVASELSARRVEPAE